MKEAFEREILTLKLSTERSLQLTVNEDEEKLKLSKLLDESIITEEATKIAAQENLKQV